MILKSKHLFPQVLIIMPLRVGTLESEETAFIYFNAITITSLCLMKAKSIKGNSPEEIQAALAAKHG